MPLCNLIDHGIQPVNYQSLTLTYMPRSVFVKSLTLFSSVSLVALFMLYRAGFFESRSYANDNSLQTSHNGGAIQTAPADSLKKDSTGKLFISSSKYAVLPDKQHPFITDSLNIVLSRKDIQMLSSSKSMVLPKELPASIETPIFFSGSKSGHMFRFDIILNKFLDSLTLKTKPFKTKP